MPEATPAPEQPPPQTIAPPPEPETPPEPEPEPVVEQDPMVANAIRALQVSGARANSSGGTIMLGTRVFMAGEVINRDLGITFVRFEDGQFTFRDERGAVYQRKF